MVSRTGGLRKVRFSPPGWAKGKSGAVRVYYAYFPEYGFVALIYAHAKADMEAITDSQRREIKALIEEIQQHLDCSR
ncbi:MAG TPA: hypothetical protein PLU35_13220 [Phycisphaerales bacterium]|nr:hypothetical protein [Phycisphaerales bacterium]